MAGRTQLVATLRYSNTCRNHYPELLVLGVVTTDAEAPFHFCSTSRGTWRSLLVERHCCQPCCQTLSGSYVKDTDWVH